MEADIVSSSTLVAVIAATMLAWQLSELAVVVELAAGLVRRRVAVHQVHVKWARFRREHPELFQ